MKGLISYQYAKLMLGYLKFCKLFVVQQMSLQDKRLRLQKLEHYFTTTKEKNLLSKKLKLLQEINQLLAQRGKPRPSLSSNQASATLRAKDRILAIILVLSVTEITPLASNKLNV